MSTINKIILATIMSMFMSYMTVSLIVFDLNIKNWHKIAKAIFIMYTLILSYFISSKTIK